MSIAIDTDPVNGATNGILESKEGFDTTAADLETPEYTPMTNTEKFRDYFVHDEKKRFNLDETVKRFRYLLNLTNLFKHFIDFKAANDPNFARALDIVESDRQKAIQKIETNNRRRKTEKEEDEELLKDEEDENEEDKIEEFTQSPGFIHGTLRPYQIQGLNWLISLYKNRLSGILADEMGLGKTLQTISFLGYLRYMKNVLGPHLVVVPKSTLDNWSREFAKWTPDVNTLVFQGDKDERLNLIKTRIMKCDFDVVITSYEIVIREKATLRKFDWSYIIIDEAHRIKNEESMLSQIIRMFHSQNRLLITGTPLQNNLHELWALLNFILPDIFSSSASFDEWFSGSKADDEHSNGNSDNNDNDVDGSKKINGNDGKDTLIQQLHKVLQPFLLRRIKNDVEKTLLPKKELNVYLGMSDMQRKWYQSILEKDIDAVNGAIGKRESKTRLLNIVMQLRKCCNHPYLFEGAEPGPPYTTDEHLVYNSQKMKLLDKLLIKSQKEGSRVLIFSQMSRMLDILEDYCVFRNYQYCRIDGQTDHVDRIQAIDDYNAPNSEKFIFLLTTRAGGLGINLTTANVVVLYDSDWNPQADLQAMDRAHRIGQKKQVYVYRFVTENAIEEKVIERLSQKLRLDQLVIQQGRNSQLIQQNKNASKDELLNMIQHGALEMFKKDSSAKADDEDDLDFDKILTNSESKTKELNNRYAKLGLDDLQNFTSSDSVYEWNGQNFQKKETSGVHLALNWINPSKRERKENYSIDGYYRDVLNTGGPRVGASKTGPKAPKNLNLYDHQFWPLKLYELHDLEKNHYKKLTKHEVPLAEGSKDTLQERLLNQKLEQEEIKRSRPLTEEEESLKQDLLNVGYYNWTRRDFYHFIQMCIKHGRNNIELIATEFEDKTLDDVYKYSETFWTRYYEIENVERYLQQIELGEEKLKKIKLQKRCLQVKLSQYDSPLQDLILKYQPLLRQFTVDEDRFIILQLFKYGIDSTDIYDNILKEFKKSSMFKFDYFIKSRNTLEISRRCQSLLNSIVKEISPLLEKKVKKEKPKLKKRAKPAQKSKNKKRKLK